MKITPRIESILDMTLKVIAKLEGRTLAEVYRAALGEYAAKYGSLLDRGTEIPEWVIEPALLAEIYQLSSEERDEAVVALSQHRLDRKQQQGLAARLAAERLKARRER
jgi:hypothetical protein